MRHFITKVKTNTYAKKTSKRNFRMATKLPNAHTNAKFSLKIQFENAKMSLVAAARAEMLVMFEKKF